MKNRRYKKEDWDNAIILKQQGFSYAEISEKLNMHVGYLKSALRTKMGLRVKKKINEQDIEEFYNQVALERTKMTREEIAKKYDRQIRWVDWVCNERAKNKVEKGSGLRKITVKKVEKVKEKPKPIIKKKVSKPPKEQKEEPKVFKQRVRSEQRPVIVNNKTTIFVDINDKRPNNEIIKSFLNKNKLR